MQGRLDNNLLTHECLKSTYDRLIKILLFFAAMPNNYWAKVLRRGGAAEGFNVEIEYFNKINFQGKGFAIDGDVGDSTSITKYDKKNTTIAETKEIVRIPATGEKGILTMKAVSNYNDIEFTEQGELIRYSPNRITLFTHYQGLESDYSQEVGSSLVFPSAFEVDCTEMVSKGEQVDGLKEAKYIDFHLSINGGPYNDRYKHKIRDSYTQRNKKFTENEQTADGHFENNWWQTVDFKPIEDKNFESEFESLDTEKRTIEQPGRFKLKEIDKITNLNPRMDTLEIDTDSFGLESSATFAAGKNKKVVKRKLANLDIDFLYDQKKGGLYFNENGSDKGFGDGGIVAILKGAPDLTANNLEFI